MRGDGIGQSARAGAPTRRQNTVTPDISPLRRVSLRWLLWRYLERGERVIAEGAVRDLDTYRLAWLVVTPTRLLLCYTSEGDTVYTLRFGDVQQALHRRAR